MGKLLLCELLVFALPGKKPGLGTVCVKLAVRQERNQLADKWR